MFYVAIFDGHDDVRFDPKYVTDRPNLLADMLPQSAPYADVVRLVRSDGLHIYSDVSSQRLVCQ